MRMLMIKLMSYFIVLCGSLMIFFPLKSIIRRIRSRLWRRVEAKIVQSRLEVTQLARPGEVLRMHLLEVEYEVKGIVYRTKPLLYAPLVFYTEKKILQLCQQLPVGHVVKARVSWEIP